MRTFIRSPSVRTYGLLRLHAEKHCGHSAREADKARGVHAARHDQRRCKGCEEAWQQQLQPQWQRQRQRMQADADKGSERNQPISTQDATLTQEV